MSGKNKILFAFVVFAIALGLRLLITNASPKNNTWIDLVIYMDGGKLIANDVNPYDHWDNITLRDSLRQSISEHNPWLAGTQERWDFYASSNLPGSLLYYAISGYASDWDYYKTRVFYCVVDALLCVLIGLFIIEHWTINEQTRILAAFVAALFSPVLLYMGALYPEDKGVQIIFMLGAIHFSIRKRFILATLFLGCSISFKGLGAFIAPLCLYYFIDSPDSWQKLANGKSIKVAILYTLATCAFAAAPFAYYLPDVFSMMVTRLDSNINANIPVHSSMWRWFHIWFGDQWTWFKWTLTSIFIILNLLLMVRKRISPEILTSSVLFWFVMIALIAGSLDRINMVLIVCTLVIGMRHIRSGFTLLTVYTLSGSILFFAAFHAMTVAFDFEQMDAAFCMIFFLSYLSMLFYHLVRSKTFHISIP